MAMVWTMVNSSMNRPKLLIDTDPGVDDALAILMAMAHADVVALTVAAGNVGIEHTLRNARLIVDLAGKDTPIFPGCPVPLVHPPMEDAAFVHGANGFGDIDFPAPVVKASDEHAVSALLRLTREHPNELTLVTLGPLTNVAMALRLDPTLPDRVARLVVMGGAVNGHGNTSSIPGEFNITFDPEAARVVFEGFPHFELVDWEATLRHTFDDIQFDRWLAAGDARANFFKAISRKSRAWAAAQGQTGVVAADALAMAVALDPGAVTRSESRYVNIAVGDDLTRGMTVVDWESRHKRPANADIVLDTDMTRFGAMVQHALGVA